MVQRIANVDECHGVFRIDSPETLGYTKFDVWQFGLMFVENLIVERGERVNKIYVEVFEGTEKVPL